ncbi:MAG: TonB-dependent receptor [Ignavibacteriaceae bacterium]|nr:TonB-dependent receptor [Ignavibacteriaceae bacterium]
MKFKFILLLLLLSLLSSFSFAQSGKIVGKVSDAQTGEPLIGANIIIEGTSLGAATNVDGEYIILNVAPNTYTLIGRYIGYKTVTLNNIRVSVNVTSEANFSLPSDTYELGEVVVTETKPLVNKNVTNSINIVGAEDMENLPVRGVANVVGTQASTVTKDGNLYVRGSRADQVSYIVDGVVVNNPVFGGASTLGIQNAVQEIQFQAGGYSAEFGGANAGIVSTTTKTGASEYEIGFEAITDNFTKVGEKFLGTYSYGYSEYVLTAGGPILPSYKKLRFFVAASNTFNKTGIAYNRGLDFKNATDPGLPKDTFDIYFPEGYIPNNASNTYQFQGNLFLDANPFQIKVNASYRVNDRRLGVGRNAIATVNRAGQQQSSTLTGSLKLTHIISQKAFYDLIVNYYDDFLVQMDPLFQHNITAYGDSIENAKLGTTLKSDGQFQTNYSLFGNAFLPVERPYNYYEKRRNQSIGGTINLLYQIGAHHELKTGGDFKYYTIRRYALPSPVSIASLRGAIPDGVVNDYYNRLDNYGYDAMGNVSEDGLTAPRNPVFAAYYIQDKMEFSDLVVNMGLRLDYIDIDGQTFKDPHNIKFTADNLIDPATLVNVEPFTQISPRLGFSFPVTDQTVFHAQYGKFVQQTRLRDVYQGYNVVADNIKGGFAIQSPVGFGLRPERTTQYEIGFKQQIGSTFAFDITGFYKDIKDQIQIRSVFADPTANHRQYYAFVNGDFSTVKGVELKFDLRRTNRLSATVDYTYSDALGTGSNPSSSFRQIWQSPTATPFFPQQVAPLDFNQTHTGFINIDFRFAKDDGPSFLGSKILERFGANLLFSFTSGFNYTRWDDQSFGNRAFPIESLNASTTPWTFQLDAKVDKTFDIGPFNANIYVWVINLLNTQNVVNVFNTSGDAYDDGWLTGPEGSAQVESLRSVYGDEKAQLYKDIYTAMNYDSRNFGTPRQIRLGIRLNY